MAVDDSDRRPFDACARCGTRFESQVTYPVETRESPAGELELYSFCGEECRAAWMAED